MDCYSGHCPDRVLGHAEIPAGDLQPHRSGERRGVVRRGCLSTGMTLPGEPEAALWQNPRSDPRRERAETPDGDQEDDPPPCPVLLACHLICPLDGGDRKVFAAGGTVNRRGLLLPRKAEAWIPIPAPIPVPIFDRAVPRLPAGRAFAHPALPPVLVFAPAVLDHPAHY